MRAAIATLAAGLLLSSPDARAHAPDLREQKQEMREKADDRRDLRQLESIVERFDRARARRDLKTLRAIDAEVSAALRAEIAESRRELAAEKADLAREVRHPGNAHALREERRDVVRESQALEQTTRIAGEWDRLKGRLDRRSLDRKRVLLRDLVSLARQELAASQDGRGRGLFVVRPGHPR